MKKLKKLSLDKEKIVNLNEQGMNELKGGSTTFCSSKICSAIVSATVSFITGDGYDYTKYTAESWMKDNTLWVGCTTDPKYSEMYGTTPGCVPK